SYPVPHGEHNGSTTVRASENLSLASRERYRERQLLHPRRQHARRVAAPIARSFASRSVTEQRILDLRRAFNVAQPILEGVPERVRRLLRAVLNVELQRPP